MCVSVCELERFWISLTVIFSLSLCLNVCPEILCVCVCVWCGLKYTGNYILLIIFVYI